MILFELIQVALRKRKSLSHNLTTEEWEHLYADSLKQSVAGVTFEGVQNLPKEQYPPKALLFKWFGISEQIKNQNMVANRRSAEITKMFYDAGLRNCILKGQGNALMYPNPLSRMSGDIDIWVDGTREAINEYVRAKCPKAFEQEHHIEFPIFKDIEVEVHYIPGTLLSPKCNKRFKEWCNKQMDDIRCLKDDSENIFYVPSIEFNMVYQMAHIMIHFFIEGIGLRHFVDYYYVLKALDGKCEKEAVRMHFKQFGLLQFAKGVMWIERECLGMEDNLLIVEPDERTGRVIMKEMLEGGNFGHHDERYKSRKNGYLARGFIDGYRLLKLAMVFPSESMWKLYRKVENQRWKLR